MTSPTGSFLANLSHAPRASQQARKEWVRPVWRFVTVIWASPRFGHPHSHIPSVLGIPGGGCPKRWSLRLCLNYFRLGKIQICQSPICGWIVRMLELHRLRLLAGFIAQKKKPLVVNVGSKTWRNWNLQPHNIALLYNTSLFAELLLVKTKQTNKQKKTENVVMINGRSHDGH